MHSLLTLAMGLVVACMGPAATTDLPPSVEETVPISSAADTYLREALKIIRDNSVFAGTADWASIEAAVMGEAAGAETPEEVYSAIELGLRLLYDRFAVFVSPADVAASQFESAEVEPPVVELRDQGVGYVAPGLFVGDPGPESDEFAADLATQIVALGGEVCGWILDLRIARFGISWPLLGGVGPLLDEGPVGGLTRADGSIDQLTHSHGEMSIGDQVMVSNSTSGPLDLDQPIAIIFGSLTRQPGEVVATAFRGQANTRIFGQPTAGSTSWMEPFDLSDGAAIAFTTARLTDRSGAALDINAPIVPDVTTDNSNASEPAALEWLIQQPACQ